MVRYSDDVMLIGTLINVLDQRETERSNNIVKTLEPLIRFNQNTLKNIELKLNTLTIQINGLRRNVTPMPPPSQPQIQCKTDPNLAQSIQNNSNQILSLKQKSEENLKKSNEIAKVVSNSEKLINNLNSSILKDLKMVNNNVNTTYNLYSNMQNLEVNIKANKNLLVSLIENNNANNKNINEIEQKINKSTNDINTIIHEATLKESNRTSEFIQYLHNELLNSNKETKTKIFGISENVLKLDKSLQEIERQQKADQINLQINSKITEER